MVAKTEYATAVEWVVATLNADFALTSLIADGQVYARELPPSVDTRPKPGVAVEFIDALDPTGPVRTGASTHASQTIDLYVRGVSQSHSTNALDGVFGRMYQLLDGKYYQAGISNAASTVYECTRRGFIEITERLEGDTFIHWLQAWRLEVKAA